MTTSNNKRRPYRKLTNIRVEEISAVDKSAGIGTKIMLRKRDGRPDYEAFFGRIFGVEKKDTTFGGYPVHGMRKNTDDDDEREDEAARVAAEMDTDDERDEDDEGFLAGDGGENGGDTAVESEDQLERAMKETNMKSHSELTRNIIKKYGLIPYCKSVANGDVRVSEHELTKLISESAARAGTTFAKLFEASTPEGVTLRKAIAAARDAQFLSRTTTMSKAQSSGMFAAGGDGSFTGSGAPGKATLAPRVTGGAASQAVNNPKSALDELQKLVDQQRAANPALTEAGAFARVYEDPANANLVARERAQNRPVATAW